MLSVAMRDASSPLGSTIARFRERYDLHVQNGSSLSEARSVICAGSVAIENDHDIATVDTIKELLLCRGGDLEVILNYDEIDFLIERLSCD